MRLSRARVGLGVGVMIAVLSTGYWIGRVHAEGIPATGALTYSGVLEDGNGPVDAGNHEVSVALFDGPGMGAMSQCPTASAMIDFAGTRGQFDVVLDDECTEAVAANPDLYMDVQIDGVPQLPRRRLGAVPFAIEARRASAAAGELADQLAAIEAKLVELDAKKPMLELNGQKYTLDGLFCGLSDSTHSGNIGGLGVAKTICEAKCGTGAHMCTSEEISRSRTLGAIMVPAPKNAWITTGAASAWTDNNAIYDCTGYTSAVGTHYGNVTTSGDYVYIHNCSSMANIACCR